MEHWFDRLSREFARKQLSRRSAFSLTTRLSLAAAGLSVFGKKAGTVAAQAIVANDASCTVEDTYGVLRTTYTTTSRGRLPLTLTHRFYAEVASGQTTSALTVTAANGNSSGSNAVILRMTAESGPKRRARATTFFGPAYTGAGGRRSEFTSDGRTVQGTVDNGATEAVPLGADHRSLRLRDGKPTDPITPSVDAAQAATLALLRQVPGAPAVCQPPRSLSSVVATCTRCQLGCREAWMTCSIEAMQASLNCGPTAAACYLKAVSACDATLQSCFQSCKRSGACCPDFCEGEKSCCDSSWGCCPPPAAPVRTNDQLRPVSQRTWSRVWPTCPRCGPPVHATTPLRRANPSPPTNKEPFGYGDS